MMTFQRWEHSEWGMMLHPPYSPNIDPSDHHLFRNLLEHLDGENMNSIDELRTILEEYFLLWTNDFRREALKVWQTDGRALYKSSESII